MGRFKSGTGDWTQYRKLSPAIEVDFHYSDYGPREIEYWDAMENVKQEALEALQRAYRIGLGYVIFTHGCSTSRLGKTTARSVVRGLVRSREATPYVLRRDSIQHESVFVAAIRSNPAVPPPEPRCPNCGSERADSSYRPAGYFKCESCRKRFDWFSQEAY